MWSTTASSCKQFQSINGFGTQQHHPMPTTCATQQYMCGLHQPVHADRQETKKRNGVKHNITPRSHVARLEANIGVNHIAITLDKDTNLDVARNMASARRNNVATQNIHNLEDHQYKNKTHAVLVHEKCRALHQLLYKPQNIHIRKKIIVSHPGNLVLK